MPGKRKKYLNWDEYFMGNAILASMRSKDPSNQVGACVVDEKNHKILSIGYNGLTRGMSDDEFDWLSTGEQTGVLKNVKDYYTVHAERNAILNFYGDSRELEGATLYVTWFPCTECTKEIIQVGIKRLVYLRMYSKTDLVEISKLMLEKAGVEIVKYNEKREFTKEEVQDMTENIQSMIKTFSENK